MQPRVLRRDAGLVAALFLMSCGSPAQGQSGVAISVGSTGLTSLRYNGTEFISSGDLRVNSILLNTGSTTTYADLTASVSFDSTRQEVTRSYSWGSIKIRYAVVGNRVSMIITTANTSPYIIQGLSYEPVALKLPQAPTEYDGNTPMLGSSVGGPTLIQMSFGSGVVVFANDDPSLPLMTGFPWALNKPTNTIFPLRINTDRDNMYPSFFPYINRPIASGGTDQISLSLRFGPPGSTLISLGQDVYQGFAAAFPQKLNWGDHRAIGMLVLATAAAGWPTNPRGYFLDPTVNVTTSAGVSAFQTRVLAYADTSIAILKSMNAQGMITWDIEGEQYPHATTYACDPRMLDTLAPEMSGVADAYFKKFRDAGLRVGVCLRPQQLVIDSSGNASQLDVADPASLLIAKIAYAKNRWGATMFYVDSNGGPNDPIDASIFQKVLAAYPDVLLVPEHKNTSYYAYTAPYRELRSGYASTAPDVRLVYPNAMSVVSTPDGDITGRYNDLVTAVQQGDALMFRSWFDDEPGNSQVKSIYQLAGPLAPPTPPPADTTPPAVSIVSPASGAMVSGNVTVSASASDNVGIVGVQFKLDGGNLGAELNTAPFATSMNTTSLSNASHTITAVARDAAGNSATATVSFTVSNVTPDKTPPAVSITAPANNATVSASITVSANATDNIGVAGVQFKVDGNNVGAPIKSQPFAATLDTTTLSNGTHSLSAVATDTAGNPATSATVTINVNNPVAPTLSCNVPGSNAFVGCYYNDRGFSSLALVRLDPQINFDWGVGSPDPAVNGDNFSARWQGNFVFQSGDYQFTLTSDDGSLLVIDNQVVGGNWSEHPAFPVTITKTMTAGTHLIRVDYFEMSGNAVAKLTWSGGGATADNTPPTVSITNPQPFATLSGTITASATAADNVGVVGVQFKVDGNTVGAEATSAPYSLIFDTTSLANGSHSITAVARDAAGNRTTSAPITVAVNNAASPAPTCSTPGLNAFTGCYYSDARWTNLVFTQTDPQINFNWGFNAPDSRLPQTYFSVRWQGNFTFSAGTHQFTMGSDDGSLLYIDNQLVLNNWGEHAAIPLTVQVPLTAGTHLVRVDYYQATGSASIALNWTPNP